MAATGTEPVRKLDAVVVGAGFGGIYMLHKLRNELGLDAVGHRQGRRRRRHLVLEQVPGRAVRLRGLRLPVLVRPGPLRRDPVEHEVRAAARDPRVPQRRRRPLRPPRAHLSWTPR